MEEEFIDAVRRLVQYLEGGVLELEGEDGYLQAWQLPTDLQDLLQEVQDYLEEME